MPVSSEAYSILQNQLAEVRHELELTEKILEQRQRVLDAIPECDVHGECVPHALEWIEKAKESLGYKTQ